MSKIKDFLKKYSLLTTFAVFMLVVFVADMFATGRQFSEIENRKLKQRPSFSWASLVSNEYTRKYEEFINDQFVARDSWISLKSIGENVLCKIENNGVAYGENGYLFGKKTTVDTEQLDKNIGYLNQFLTGYTGPVTFGIIPNSYEMLPSYLPVGMEAIQVKQQPDIERIYDQVQGADLTKLDLFAPLTVNPADPTQAWNTYYRTDHHWTTDGAWQAYKAYCDSQGIGAVALSDLAPLRREELDFYGTYYSKAKKLGTPADTLVWYDIPTTSVTINGKETLTDADGSTMPVTGLYQTEKFGTRDKYAGFLYGNNGLTLVKSDNNRNHRTGETSRILLIKDSYGNSLAPFLTYSYDEVWIVDLRGLPEKLSTLVQRTKFDDLLVLYNYESFESDRNFARMTF